MQSIPLAFQTTYADLLDKLLDERVRSTAQASGMSERGSFVVKIVKGRRYWYWQSATAGNGRTQRSVGPETPALLERIERHRSLADTARSRRDLVRSLIAGGAAIPPAGRVGKVLEALAGAGVFRLRGVLVGAVAFGCYGPMLGIRLRAASLMTADVDVAQFRSVSLAVTDQVPPMLDVLRGVDAGFQQVTAPFHPAQAIAYATQGREGRGEIGSRPARAADPLRVEFLTPMRGPPEDAPGRLPALSTDAQPLRFLDYLIYQERPAAVLYGAGVLVNVPHPARFAWHKCIVAERRLRPEKVRKDLLQAETLFDVLVAEHPADVSDMFEELAGPGRRFWQEIALSGLAKIDPRVRSRVLALLDVPGQRR